MLQTLYGLIAIALVMMLSLNLMRAVTGTQRKMVVNEVATQVTGISVDIMEHLGNKAFDEKADETGIDPSAFPIIGDVDDLTLPAGFGSTLENGKTCDHANFYDPDCNDLDDFHGMTLNRVVNGIPYTAEITVRYVDPDNPNQGSGGRTYAKEVVVDITSPYLLVGDTPVTATFSRVFAYHRITVL